ncbi:hypothetical protein [Marichromatium bheemlicum]|uniref:Type IV pilus biogenesis protein PilP n=1 Tax=Marichromatium bheemlicum TaxID=365339 RepID=A0ABX1I351_9GAMM|nr:hypothetical protein [Marichromatium bheemlicum]NKN31682.1 hypothetical protein [Marichromatium bheemlicum]
MLQRLWIMGFLVVVSVPGTSGLVLAAEAEPTDDVGVEVAPLSPALATRARAARQRLTALQQAGAAEVQSLARAREAADAAEHARDRLAIEAAEAAMEVELMRACLEEIGATADGLRLPPGTVSRAEDQSRPLPQRDAMPLTSFEPSPRVVRATLDKLVYADLDSTTTVAEIAAGEAFVVLGTLRGAQGQRRLLGWISGRGQVLVADGDIAEVGGRDE